MRKISIFVLMFLILGLNSLAQQVNFSGKVVNPDEKPINKVLVYLANNPSLYCYSDSLGNFSLTDISTSVTEVKQDKIISFENRKLSLFANNQSITVDVFTIDGRQVKNIVNLRYCLGTFGLYPEAYLSGLPKAIYIVRAIVGNTFQSFKIQNIIPSGFPQGITEYDINNIIDKSFTEPKSEPNIETKSEALDTLVLVHDFYKSRKIPIDSYSIQYDTIHLNNFSDYSIAEGFEPAVTYLYSGYGEFTNIRSEGDIQFIIDYDTLSILNDDLKLITIPVGEIENLDNSIKFISGLHLEPSGTKFIQPVQVTVLLKDSIPKRLVVFQYDDQGKTNYVPYVTHALSSSRYYSVVFIINHFSSIGIGTGEITFESDPMEFTTSDQFLSYLARCIAKNEEVPEAFFDTWYNNIIAPMKNNPKALDDLIKVLNEILIMQRTNDLLGLDDQDSLDQAMKIISDKMKEIWNELIVEYNELEDYCLKLEILNIALQMCKISDLVGNLYEPDIDDFGNGEISNLTYGIEFLTPVKHLKIGESYVIEYTLNCLSGNCIQPPIINWYTRNPRVAALQYEGKTVGIVGLSEGVTIVKGTICDQEFTFKVEVGGVNCEKDYCINKYDSCYSGTYKCTGVLRYSGDNPSTYCESIDSFIQRYTFVGSLNDSFQKGYFEIIHSGVADSWGSYSGECTTTYVHITYYTIETGGFYCYGTEYFRYNPSGYGEPDFYGYLKENILTIDAKKWIGWEGISYATTSMHCIRIDE